jgi:uncharacterized protein (TIGR03000 family)
MRKYCWSVLGSVAVAVAALLMSPGTATAQHHGGGGGGHGGGASHGGGHEGGGGHGSGGSWSGHDGHGWEGGHGWGGWGWGLGFGFPGYYGWNRPYWGNYGGYGPGYYGGYSDYSYPYYGYDNSYPGYYSYPDYYGPDFSYVPDYSYSQNLPSYDLEQSAPDNRAHIRVRVPGNAQLWFDDQPTTRAGSVRTFTSPDLTPGHTYTYDLRAQWRQGNQDVTQTRHVVVHPGEQVMVDFLRPMPGNQRMNPPSNQTPMPREVNPQGGAPRPTNPPPPPVPRSSGT